MNSNSIKDLSYKELQTLALRYRVPGNIKKKLLIRVLQAAKSGNEREVDRLLHDLKQTRKKRTRKTKPRKLGITSTPLHRPDYTMADDFYSPQQQLPQQWVGAEEEISIREEEAGIPHYEEFRKFLLRRIQKECRACDTNNNRIKESSIIDFRTNVDPLDVNTLAVESYGYSRQNVITVDENNACVLSTSSPIEYQILEDPNSTAHGSVLLKKMLQAPVGANLGEIASPVMGDYRIWSSERYQSENILDNSDTLTADSENTSQENLPADVDCYGFVDNARTEYALQDTNFVGNTEETAVQLSGFLTSENHEQYRYAYQNYQHWPASTAAGLTELNCVAPQEADSNGTFRTMYYDGTLLNNGLTNNEPSTYQFHTNENAVYGSSTAHVQFAGNPTEEGQYYHPDMLPGMQCDPLDTYYLQNMQKQGTNANDHYFVRESYQSHAAPIASDPIDRQAYPTEFQNGTNTSRQHSVVYHDHQQPTNMPTNEYLKQRVDDIAAATRGNQSQKETGSSEVLEPFVPKRAFATSSSSYLENILNVTLARSLASGKVGQTCCVYCYTAPVLADKEAGPAISSSRMKRFVVEERQHSFCTNWLAYDDSSLGLRMANLKTTNESERDRSMDDKSKDAKISPASDSNIGIRKSMDISDESAINDIWIHDYNGLQTPSKGNGEVYDECSEHHAEILEYSIEETTADIPMRTI